MRGLIRTGGGGAVPQTTDSAGNPAGNTVAEIGSDFRGNYPTTWFLQSSATTTTQTNDAEVYESGDVSMYNHHVIENLAGKTDAVTVQVSLDGTNWSGDYPLTGTVAASPLIEAGEFGVIEGKFYKIRVLKDGAAAENPEIRYAHSVK